MLKKVSRYDNDYNSTISGFADSVQEPKGNLGVPMDISSPITSDEEYLSPMEEVMDFGGPEPRRTIDTHFRKPPAFLVRLCKVHWINLTLPFSVTIVC